MFFLKAALRHASAVLEAVLAPEGHRVSKRN